VRISSIGVGPTFPRTPYVTSSFKITADDQLVVIGCGPRIPEVLGKHGHSLSEVDVWVVPALCSSQITGLIEVAAQMRFDFEKKPILMAPLGIMDGIIKTIMPSLTEYSKRIGKTSRLDDFFNVITSREMKIKETVSKETYYLSLIPHEKKVDTSHGILIEEIPLLITGTKKFDLDWLMFYGGDAKAIIYDINTNVLNTAEEMNSIQSKLPIETSNSTWLYGYNLSFHPKNYPTFNFLAPNTAFFDSKRILPVIDKFGKEKIEAIKKRTEDHSARFVNN
jgi:hypothetical protein